MRCERGWNNLNDDPPTVRSAGRFKMMRLLELLTDLAVISAFSHLMAYAAWPPKSKKQISAEVFAALTKLDGHDCVMDRSVNRAS
jgi:hypothetical protein